jgi:hypothetical protein
MAEHRVGLILLDPPIAVRRRARERLEEVLGQGSLTEPDDVGVFEARVDAEDFEHALRKVWDAIAAAGVDDHVAFLEHPDLPEHWRPRAASPTL